MTNDDDTPDTNPHNFNEIVMASINKASGEAYDAFFDLLATYQFGFLPEEKVWIIDYIAAEMKAVTLDPDNI